MTNSKCPLKTEEAIRAAVKFFNDTMQWAGWNTMPEDTGTFKTYQSPILMKQKIIDKRRLRETGIDYKHERANDYSTQQHRNPNSFSSQNASSQWMKITG
jgi:hypothetical protein